MDAAGSLALVVLGAIIGWVIQLIVDFLVLRPHWIAQGRQQASTVPDEELRAALREQVSTLRKLEAIHGEQSAALARLNAQLAEGAQGAATPTAALLSRLEGIGQISEALEAQREELRETLAGVGPQPDDLTAIKGIGPVYAARLAELGIQRFEQLAALSADDLSAMIDVEGRPRIDAEGWIAQAKAFASGRLESEDVP